nr:hypothetical protein Q903MT_gene3452 [Picea sitchensis]
MVNELVQGWRCPDGGMRLNSHPAGGSMHGWSSGSMGDGWREGWLV